MIKRSCIVLAILALVANSSVYGQCTCMGGASVGGLTPVGGSANIGVLKEDNFRAAMYYRYGFGDKYYAGLEQAPNLTIKEYAYSFLGINLGYGITEDLTAEFESGYFLQKMQNFFTYKLQSSGFSHISASLKYNFYTGRVSEWEYTAGLGARAPLDFTDDNVPQNILPSTGAYGLLIHSFLHKGFKKEGLHLFLVNRAEFNTTNSKDYQYGITVFSSLFTSKTILDNLAAMLELRNEYRAKDRYNGNLINDSGSLVFALCPQVSYKVDDFYLSAYFDYPFYKDYNGKQLANSYSLGMVLTWQAELDFEGESNE